MSAKVLLIALGLVLVLGKEHKIRLNSDKTSMSTGDHHNLGLFGYNYFWGFTDIFGTGLELGVTPDLNLDLGIGYNIYLNKYN